MNGPKIKKWTVQKATPGLCEGMKQEGLVGESGRHKWQKLDCAKETRRSQGMKADGLMEWNPFHPFEPSTLDRIMKSFKKLFAKIFAQQFF